MIMTRDTLKHKIIDIICEQCGYEKTFFTVHPNDGESLLMTKILYDPLDAYETLSTIENVCKILVNDEMVFKSDNTFGDFIDVFYNEYKRERNGLA